MATINKHIWETSKKFMTSKEKKERKELGQFFTPVSVVDLMVEMTGYPDTRDLNLLEAGAGTGILSISLLEELICKNKIDSAHVDMYEIEEELIPILQNNADTLKSIVDTHKCHIDINIRYSDFICSNESVWKNDFFPGIYDMVIGNPPFAKICKSSPQSQIMGKVVHGQPNLFFLFMGMCVKLLRGWHVGVHCAAFLLHWHVLPIVSALVYIPYVH